MVASKNIKIVDGVQYNKCAKCAKWLPANREYFHWANENKQLLQAICIKCVKIYCEENAEKLKIRSQTYRKNNKEKIKASRKRDREKMKAYCEENKEKLKARKKVYNKKNKERHKRNKKIYDKNDKILFTTFAQQLTVDDAPKDDGKGYLLVKCTYCGKYFYPTNVIIRRRINVLKGQALGEARLYCSEGCKDACPIFNQILWPKGFKPATSREVNPLVRQMCLERDEYTCQRCGKTIDEIELHAHHIEGITQQPMLANDVKNTITLCKPCHIWVHQQDGCTNRDLRCKK